eukprot:2939530-Amphidinium_carterae.1
MAVCRYPLSIVVLVSLAAVAAEASAFAPLIRQVCVMQMVGTSWSSFLTNSPERGASHGLWISVPELESCVLRDGEAHQLMIFSWILWLSLLLVIIPACELHDAVHFKAFVRLRG